MNLEPLPRNATAAQRDEWWAQFHHCLDARFDQQLASTRRWTLGGMASILMVLLAILGAIYEGSRWTGHVDDTLIAHAKQLDTQTALISGLDGKVDDLTNQAQDNHDILTGAARVARSRRP